MLAKLRKRLSFANVVSVIALFVALGGTSVAAVTLKRNSVRSKHIKNEQVQSVDVKNASLLSQDFAPGQLPQGERGETGQQGDRGERGPAGPTDGSASASLNNAPPAYADTEGPHAETNVTLAAPGKLFVSGTTQTQIDCDPTPPGGCLDRWGLYVDGQPVPGSGRTLFIDAGGSELAEFTLLGVAAGQPAGSRHVELRRQLTGPWAGRGGGHRQVAGIALGG